MSLTSLESRSNALAHVYLHLTGLSVMIHILHMQHSNTPTFGTDKKTEQIIVKQKLVACYTSNMHLRIYMYLRLYLYTCTYGSY